MTMTVETAQLNNQNILQNFALVEEIDEQAAEIISGGYEVFTIKNNTNTSITHTLDGTEFLIQPGEQYIYTAYNGGIIEFDTALPAIMQYSFSPCLSHLIAFSFKDVPHSCRKCCKDARNDYYQSKSYDLEEGQIYEFQDNTYTPGNPYDIDLYRVS